MTLTCEWCGRTFDRPHGRGPLPKFCSSSHRQRAYQERAIERRIEAAVADHIGRNDPS